MKHLPVLGDLGATLLTPDSGGHAALPRAAASAVGSWGNPFSEVLGKKEDSPFCLKPAANIAMFSPLWFSASPPNRHSPFFDGTADKDSDLEIVSGQALLLRRF